MTRDAERRALLAIVLAALLGIGAQTAVISLHWWSLPVTVVMCLGLAAIWRWLVD